MPKRESQRFDKDASAAVIDSNEGSRSEAVPRVHIIAADALSGEDVRNEDGETIGELAHIMVDFESGRVAYAVLSMGGFLGVNDKLVAVPWTAFQQDPDEDGLRLSVTRAQLEEAEALDEDDWSDMTDRRWVLVVLALVTVGRRERHLT